MTLCHRLGGTESNLLTKLSSSPTCLLATLIAHYFRSFPSKLFIRLLNKSLGGWWVQNPWLVLKIINLGAALPPSHIKIPSPQPPLFPLALPVTNHTRLPDPDLWCHINSAHRVLHAVNPKLGDDYWLWVPLSGLSYRALGLIQNNCKLSSMSVPGHFLQSHPRLVGEAPLASRIPLSAKLSLLAE